MTFDTELGVLPYFTVQGVVGIPERLTGGKLRTELWYPADGRTRELRRDWHEAPTGTRP